MAVSDNSPRLVVNRTRTGSLCLFIGGLSVTLCLAGISEMKASPTGWLLLASGGAGVLLAGRVAIMGTWVSGNSITVRRWFSSPKLSRDEIVAFDSYRTNSGIPYPGVVSTDGRLLELPMLARGLIQEAHSPDRQWGRELNQLREWLASRSSRK